MNTSFDKTLLFFLPGPVPTQEDRDLAKRLMLKLETAVMFRNGNVDSGGGNPEKCNYVYGAAPDEYRKQRTVVNEDGDVVSEPVRAEAPKPANEPLSTTPSDLAAEIGSVTRGWGS